MMDTWANDMARDMDKAAVSGSSTTGSESFAQIETFLLPKIMTVNTLFSSEDSDEYDEFTDSLQGEVEVELSESPVNELQHLSHEETVHALFNPRISREEKNERERSRIKRKGDLLDELKDLIKRSSLIPADGKRKRFTEMYTLKLAQELIIAHHNELKKRLGCSSQLPLPFSSGDHEATVERPTMYKQYTAFEKAFRASFAELLRKYSSDDRAIKVDDRRLYQFTVQVWECLSYSERQHNWSAAISSERRSKIIKFARSTLNES